MSCAECGFALWNPVADLSVSAAGLYVDSRYPGRLIVSLNEHYEHYDAVPAELLNVFMEDVRRACAALRSLGADRANVAILGNTEAHVHAHVIPRRNTESNSRRAPWDTRSVNIGLDDAKVRELVTSIGDALRGD